MELVLNELSYAVALSESQAKSWYDNLFIEICLKTQKEFKTKLNLQHSLSPKLFQFHESYSFEKWISELEKDDRSIILSMLTSEPFIQNYPYYKFNDEEGMGLGYAFENDGVLISFLSNNFWKSLNLAIVCESLSEDGIEYEDFEVKNCFDEESVKSHYDHIKKVIDREKKINLNSIISGNELWKKKDNLFPNLIFCESNQGFIESLSGQSLNKILIRLEEFNQYFMSWTNGVFDHTALSGKVRPESSTRETKYNTELTVKCPDGINRFFTLHCNYGVYGYRLHFCPDITSRTCYIGYVGRKIGT